MDNTGTTDAVLGDWWQLAWPDYWICLGISVLTYMPFVLAANKMMAADSQSKQDTDTTTETVKA